MAGLGDPQHWTRYSLPLKPRVWLISESQMHCSCLPRSDRDRAWATAWSAAVREGGQLSRWGSCAVADPECQSAISEIIVGCADQKRNRMTGCRGRGVCLALGASLTLVGCRVLSISLVTMNLGSSSVEAPCGCGKGQAGPPR